MRQSDRSSGLFLCACLVTVMDCLVGMMQEDAQAPRTRNRDVRAARTACATSRGGPWDSGAAAAGTSAAAAEPPPLAGHPRISFIETISYDD